MRSFMLLCFNEVLLFRPVAMQRKMFSQLESLKIHDFFAICMIFLFQFRANTVHELLFFKKTGYHGQYVYI